MAALNPAILEQLRQIVGTDRVLTDADSAALYGRDWTRVHEPGPAAVVLPASVEEVQDIAAFDEAMAEEGPNIPWEQVKADLGWQ